MHVQVGIQEAAKTLGISPSTLKRLCDQNIVPSFRTPGGHRRFDRTLIDIARRRLLGQSPGSEIASTDHTWLSLMRQGRESELCQYLRTLGGSGKLVESIDAILQDSILAFDSLSASSDSGGYRLQMAFQAVLNAITWKSTRFLTRHSCQARALGISSGLPVDEIGSSIVELALRMSRLDALSIRSCTQADQLVGFAQRVQASHIWLCHLTDQTALMLEQQIRFLLNAMHADCTLLVLAPHFTAANDLYGPRCQLFTKVSQLLTVQMDGIESVHAPSVRSVR